MSFGMGVMPEDQVYEQSSREKGVRSFGVAMVSRDVPRSSSCEEGEHAGDFLDEHDGTHRQDEEAEPLAQ